MIAPQKKGKDPTAALRVARMRARGRRVEVILQDRAAISALDRLTKQHGSIRAAVEHALNSDVGRPVRGTHA